MPKTIEFALSHDDYGELPIGDPAHEDGRSRNRRESEKIEGFRVTKMHDGFCQGIRYRLAVPKSREEKERLEKALTGGLSVIYGCVSEAKRGEPEWKAMSIVYRAATEQLRCQMNMPKPCALREPPSSSTL